jgi:hypothetical protein
MRDKFFKVMLAIIAVLLLLNLFNQQISSLITPSEAIGGAYGGGGGIACSSSGEYVYVLTSDLVQYSDNYGHNFIPTPIMSR